MSLQPPTREQVIAHHQAHGPVRIAGGNVRIGITIEGDPDALTAVEPMRVETDIPWRVLPHEVRAAGVAHRRRAGDPVSYCLVCKAVVPALDMASAWTCRDCCCGNGCPECETSDE